MDDKLTLILEAIAGIRNVLDHDSHQIWGCLRFTERGCECPSCRADRAIEKLEAMVMQERSAAYVVA